MNVLDILEFVKTHNLPLDVELGFITDEGYYGTAQKLTVLTNGLGEKLLCLDNNYDDWDDDDDDD